MRMVAPSLLVLALAALPCAAQGFQAAEPSSASLPITKVVLFSSGVAYFEHRGQVTGDCLVSLPFDADEVNDALKSLVVVDGSTARPR